MALSVDTTPAKHVTVLRNGDNKYEGRRFIVSRRRYRTFDSLLSDITHQISAPFGAVRRLYTPKGRRQIRGIDDLEGGGTYIAGGSERFKKIDYSPLRLPGKNWATLAAVRPGFLADDPPPLILPRKPRRYAQRSAQFYKVRQPIQFTVYRNGLPNDKGARFLLKSREMKSYETVLSIISLKIRLIEGAVRRLYTREGASLIVAEDIVDGGVYVACGHRRFIPGPYGEVPPPPARLQKLPAIKRSKEANQISPRTQSNPLPAIQRKAAQPKARSEKDSPAPIEEDKGISKEGSGDPLTTVSRGSQADILAETNNQVDPGNPPSITELSASNSPVVDNTTELTSPAKSNDDQNIEAEHSSIDESLTPTNAEAIVDETPVADTPLEVEHQTTAEPDVGATVEESHSKAGSVNYDNEFEQLSDLLPGSVLGNAGDAARVKEEAGDEESASTIPDMVTEPEVDDTNQNIISKTEVNTAVSKKLSKISNKNSSIQAVSSEDVKKVPSKNSTNQANSSEDVKKVTSKNSTIQANSSEDVKKVTSKNSTVPTIQAISSEEVSKVPSKSGLDRNPPDKTPDQSSGHSIPTMKSSSMTLAVPASDSALLSGGATDEPSVFNATSGKPGQDGNFLMSTADEAVNDREVEKEELADEVEEDTDLVEDKPIELQQAEEVEEEDINKPNA